MDPTSSDSGKPARAPVYWLEEAAVYLGLDRNSTAPRRRVYRAVSAGYLRAISLGGKMAFLKADLDDYLARGDVKRETSEAEGNKKPCTEMA